MSSVSNWLSNNSVMVAGPYDWLVMSVNNSMATGLSMGEEVSDLIIDSLNLLDVMFKLVKAVLIELLLEVVLRGNTDFLAEMISLSSKLGDSMFA